MRKSFPSLQRAVVSRAAYSDAAQTEGEQMRKQKVLFICVHNSARSQMAAALLNQTCGEFFEAQSAGLEPGTINPLVVEALLELGIDISKNTTQRVFDVWTSGQIFQFVVTVCSEAEAEGCPIFAGVTTRLHWPFDDPSKFTDARGTVGRNTSGPRSDPRENRFVLRGALRRRQNVKKSMAEFLSTFALVFAGTGAIVINETSGGVVTQVGVALTFGLIVLAIIYTMATFLERT